MKRLGRVFATCAGLLPGLLFADAALAQKQGGILRVFHRDSPASMSILEEGSISAIMPMMGVFNNLVLFDQHVPQNRIESILPELATSWSLSEEGTELSFKLREGVKWHDGKPFTWCSSRSRIAVATTGSPNTLPHSPGPAALTDSLAELQRIIERWATRL